MRLPFGSEPEAFRLALAFAFGVGVSVLLGYLLVPVAGVALFMVSALAELVWLIRTEPATTALSAAELAGHERGAGDRSRVLVVANEALPGDAPPDEIVGP